MEQSDKEQFTDKDFTDEDCGSAEDKGHIVNSRGPQFLNWELASFWIFGKLARK